MYFKAPDLSDILDRQLTAGSASIGDLKQLLYGKCLEEVQEDYDLFCQCNTIMRVLDNHRTFLHYDKDKRVKESVPILTGLQNDLGPFATYCDIGCGMGFYSRAAFEIGCVYSCGIDIDEQYRPTWDYYTQGTNGKLQYMCGDITRESPQTTFDLVTSFAAFEHFSDPPGMLKAMADFVTEDGCLYLYFGPLYLATTGMHMYRHISIPWFHLIFSETVIDRYCNEHGLSGYKSWNQFNKWTPLDYMLMFSNLSSLQLVSCTPLWDLRHYWFVKLFPELLPAYALEDLLCVAFTVVYKNTCSPKILAEKAANKLEIKHLQSRLKKEQDKRLKMKSTLSWRFTSPLRQIRKRLYEYCASKE